MEAAMAFHIDLEVAQRHQLPEYRSPLPFVEFGADAERLQPIVSELAHAFGQLAAQHVDEMRDAEALPGAKDGRERFLRRHQPIPDPRRLQAMVAIAAGRMIALAE